MSLIMNSSEKYSHSWLLKFQNMAEQLCQDFLEVKCKMDSTRHFHHSQHYKANSEMDGSVLGPLGFPDFLFGNVFEFSSE